MTRRAPVRQSALLQCRGPERRLTRWHVLAALVLFAGFVGAAGTAGKIGAVPTKTIAISLP